MLRINCDKCHKELNEPGMLVFGAPDRDGLVWKGHLCSICAQKVVNWINQMGGNYAIDRANDT